MPDFTGLLPEEPGPTPTMVLKIKVYPDSIKYSTDEFQEPGLSRHTIVGIIFRILIDLTRPK